MKKNKKVSSFFGEFKKFITRGNVVDLAVGVIIGGAFTAIVTALTSNILQPLINWVISLLGGGDALASARTMLSAVKSVDEATGKEIIDWSSSIYIDWGAFISAIINFLLVAFVLFIVVKVINGAKDKAEQLKAMELEKYYQKHPKERPVEPAPEAPKPTTEELLSQIRDIIKEKK